MNSFLFDEELIVNYLIAKRVSLAKRQHDKAIVDDYCRSSRIIPDNDENKLIHNVMPSRNSWVKLYKNERNNCKNSVSRNKQRLKITIKRDRGKPQVPAYIMNLNCLIEEIKTRGESAVFEPKPPIIIPKKKNKKDIKEGLRPICVFDLKDNIIYKCVNKYLTQLLDPFFLDCSFAFRARRENNYLPKHHDTIQKILDFQKTHSESTIFVAECDLQKFFDTINHQVIKKAFYHAICEIGINIPSDIFGIIERVFFSYLNVYDFQTSVSALNKDDKYLSRNHCTGGEFKWIKASQLEKIYDDFSTIRLGIPQGGALSGLVANCVLDYVDKKVMEVEDHDFLYLRYCDDMVMMHTNKDVLKERLATYCAAVEEQKLFVHDPKVITGYSKDFYTTKSKLPYKWGGDIKQGEIPWVSFVGYQIGYNGEVRVRKNSIDKEVEKQKRIVGSAIRHISIHQNKRRSDQRIMQSVYNRLCGMSVGRIDLYPSKCKQSNPLCWTNGFKNLNYNKFSAAQMRYLDRRRRNVFRWFCKELKQTSSKIRISYPKSKARRCITYWGLPYSYYGWLKNKK